MTISRKQAENIASVLSEGLPYIRKFKDKIIVVKYGGAAMTDPSLKESFSRDIALMKLVGMKPVIVHGGGPQIGKELEKAGIESKFENGLRVTNKPTMNIVKKILGTQINHEITRLIKKFGGNSISFNHSKYQIVNATKKSFEDGTDLGLVGEVIKIRTSDLKKSLSNGFIPVIAPIGVSKNNEFLNINADEVAGEVAQALKAEKLILLTDVKGIGDSDNKLISKISLSKGQKILKEKFIKGGMTPKLLSALSARRSGVKSCHIIDGRVPHAVLLEVLTEEGVGTMIS
jgi:acetylglutamate kinase|tara:strand:+ start:611 stop:1474 length:864 start_codon:yes stop_codon:yes gene_type:complete